MARTAKRDDLRTALVVETGARIKAAREEMGVTQAGLAALMVPPRTDKWLSDIERGLNSIDPHDLKAVADVLGYPLEWFLDQAYAGRNITRPKTRLDWELLFDDRERARAHFELDRAFERVESLHAAERPNDERPAGGPATP